MKKGILLLMFLLFVSYTATPQGTFHRRTNHKTVKKLKPHELKKIQSGYNLYYREGSNVYKTSRFWSSIKRPKDATKRK
jgi:hypothetical protein